MVWMLGDLLEKHADEFAQLEALDNGKPVKNARRDDIGGSIAMFRYMAGWGTMMTILMPWPNSPTTRNTGCRQAMWTRNLKVAHSMAKKIKAGTICVNNHNYGDPAWPFGGYKQSGWGCEMGKEVMENYTETKSVAVDLG